MGVIYFLSWLFLFYRWSSGALCQYSLPMEMINLSDGYM
uniref:Uncharacterized protein n=1 Tax=Anguilla anguilla TaxID=7936 RepID=A0A0E9W4G5_ANGAN